MAGVLFDKNQTELCQFPGGKGGDYTIPDSVTNISGTFWACDKLTNVVMGTNITSIPDGLFEHCTSLNNIVIPKSVTSIGIFAFLGCASLTTVTIPFGVTNIGNQAFSYCPQLIAIYFLGNAPTNIGMDPFDFVTLYYLPGTSGWEASFMNYPTALWLPEMRSDNNSYGIHTNQFGFTLNWASGQTVVVEACTNLFNPDWQPLQTNTLTSGSAYFSDPQWMNYPGRFYRLRSP
jgi:hypothetical protein